MGLVNRHTLRDGVVTMLKTCTGLADVGATVHVFGQLPPSFSGISPVATVENGGWEPDIAGDDTDPISTRFVIGFWRRITNDSRDNAEDALDVFAGELTNKLRASYNARYYELSQPFYELMDGVDYRGEYHFVEIWR
jgi:hypothetical protein